MENVRMSLFIHSMAKKCPVTGDIFCECSRCMAKLRKIEKRLAKRFEKQIEAIKASERISGDDLATRVQ